MIGEGMYKMGDAPVERYDHSLLSVGIIEHPDGQNVLTLRGLAGPLKYDCWLTVETARKVAAALVEHADLIDSGAEIPFHPTDMDNH